MSWSDDDSVRMFPGLGEGAGYDVWRDSARRLPDVPVTYRTAMGDGETQDVHVAVTVLETQDVGEFAGRRHSGARRSLHRCGVGSSRGWWLVGAVLVRHSDRLAHVIVKAINSERSIQVYCVK